MQRQTIGSGLPGMKAPFLHNQYDILQCLALVQVELPNLLFFLMPHLIRVLLAAIRGPGECEIILRILAGCGYALL